MSVNGGDKSWSENHWCVDDDDSVFTKAYVSKFSPRSAEACAQEGVQPRELIPITMEDIEFDQDDPIEIRQLRLEHAVNRRMELLHDVRRARRRLVRSGWEPPKHIETVVEKPIPIETLQAVVGGATANMIEAEKKRLQQLMIRQEKELKQLVQYEMKVCSLEEKQKQKQLARNKREEFLRRQREQQHKEIMERNRQIQLRKKQEEEREQQRRKTMQEEMYLKSQRAHKEQRLRERQKRAEARAKAEQRHRHQSELREKTEAIFNEQMERTARKLASMQRRDDIRRRKNEEARRLELAQKAKLMKERHERVAHTVESNQQLLEQKRFELGKKMQSKQQSMEKFQLERESKLKELRKSKMESDNRRRRVKEQCDEEQAKKVQAILEKNERAELKKRELQRKAKAALAVKKELQHLRQAAKLDNVERKKRIDQYKRCKTLEKIELDLERTKVLQKVKSDMIQERKRNHVMSSIQKQEILRTFQSLRLSDDWKKIPALQNNATINGDNESQ